MEDKTEQIWSRFNHDQANLKRDCVDLLSKCYLMLGQKPDTQQVVLMSQLLYNDLVESYSSYTIEKVGYIFETAIKETASNTPTTSGSNTSTSQLSNTVPELSETPEDKKEEAAGHGHSHGAGGHSH
mgnify:CR=1 FL=1